MNSDSTYQAGSKASTWIEKGVVAVLQQGVLRRSQVTNSSNAALSEVESSFVGY